MEKMLLLLQNNWPNAIALGWFLLCFRGYMYYSAYKSHTTPCLVSMLHLYRTEWMQRMLSREVRIADTTAIANLERSVAFFASTTILVLAGLMTVMGSAEKAINLVQDLPFVVVATPQEWEFKLLLLVVLFIYAFFKFTWSLRQYGFVSVMIGGAPLPTENPSPTQLKAHAERIAQMASMAAHNFNLGLRTYYFSISVLGWFISPWVFMLLAASIVVVLYRREFTSSTLKTLMMSSGGES
ncbi:MAG: DUF599 family protein [Oceanospirillales bacterium]|uniref:Putative membrane protein n=1 Tax=Marinobacterium halophilum TaxID=267374 RepID=A0A2P8F0G2_9GAMM|nr:DUF599 domain-containing protein [Marinobacterium halophilum]MBR9829249.1 DUF599 family protein [Oceanospirillales bacterium]PSL15214.1 putative membrane protein [Marinobacterium halophilum]